MTAVLTSTQSNPTQDRLQALTGALSRALLGKEVQINLFMSAILGGGHVLLVDSPGVGKTTLAKGFATSVGGSFARVQGTSDLLPTDLTGVSIYDPSSANWVFHPGPLSRHVVLVDEINRIPARTQSALLEALAENQVSVDGSTYPTPSPFSVVATANPGNEIGTFPVVSGLMDRFGIALSIGLPSRESERSVALGLTASGEVAGPAIALGDLQVLRDLTDAVVVVDALVDYSLDLIDEVRREGWLSPRASQSLIQTAKGRALLAGRNHVIPDDIRDLAPFVLGHRLSSSAADQILQHQEQVTAIIATVPVPVPGR